jgi:hypothetical protein
MSSLTISSFDDGWDLSGEEDIAMMLTLHANKRPKHSGYIFGWQKIQREMIEGHNKLIHSYFLDDPIFTKSTLGAI